MDSFGFVLVRCVQSPQHNLLWQEAYRCIRKYHAEKIILIDDNSRREFLTEYPTPLENVTLVQSEFPGAGEFLLYYYFYQLKLFRHGILIHDSMFLQQPFSLPDVPLKFLWHCHCHKQDPDEEVKRLIGHLHPVETTNLLTIYEEKKWQMCFGASLVIDYEVLARWEDKYQLMNLASVIHQRDHRMALERLVGLLTYHDGLFDPASPSLFGNILHHPDAWGIDFSRYQTGRYSYLPVVKVWSGR